MKYNKLVRDSIPEYITSKGEKAIIHIANDEEYWEKLKEKLSEEVQEFYESETIDELADILEVIDAISEYKKFDSEKILEIKNKKAQQRGKFEKRVILDES